jgi:hypothetical protein
MSTQRIKFTALTIVLLGTFAAGAGSSGQVPDRQAGKPESPLATTKPNDTHDKPAPGRMFVVGRVLDPDGKPVPNASVMVYGRVATINLDAPAGRLYVTEIGHASSDGQGRIRVDVPRTSSSRHDEFGVVAVASGFGAGWAELDADAEQPAADIKLRPEQLIHGRLFDLLGQPARDVKLSVTAIRRVDANQTRVFQQGFEGPAFWWTHPDDLPGWPSPAISDATGRFTLRGIGSGIHAFITVVDPRFNNQVIEINTETDLSTKPLSVALQPARTMIGRVTYADTGKPAARARVQIAGFDQFQIGVGARPVITTTDDEGRFRAHPGPGADGFISAFAPGGQPYLVAAKNIDWPKGAVAYSADLALSRGTMVRGKVTEHDSRRPIPDALVAFFHGPSANDSVPVRATRPVQSGTDGSFTLVIPDRPGYLVVRGPADDFIRNEIDDGLLYNGQHDGSRAYVHAFLPWKPKPGAESQNANITLRRGATVRGQVVGPDGLPVSEVWMISRVHTNPRTPLFLTWSPAYHGMARNGRFQIHGLDPSIEVPVSFLEPKRKLGATVRVSAKRASSEPVVVKLEPCGTASARLVGPDGKPLHDYTPRAPVMMVVTPGEFSPLKARKEGTFMLESGGLAAIDPVNYMKPPSTDEHGRIVFPALIPGTTYQIVDRSTAGAAPGMQLRKEFTVKSGETVDLGDILIEKPR